MIPFQLEWGGPVAGKCLAIANQAIVWPAVSLRWQERGNPNSEFLCNNYLLHMDFCSGILPLQSRTDLFISL